MNIRAHDRPVRDADHLQAYITSGRGSIAGSLLLADVWQVDPYECGGDIRGTFSNGETPDDEGIIYFSSAADQSPTVRHAVVSKTAQSFALGALMVVSRRELAPAQS